MEIMTKAVGLVETTETDDTNGAFEVVLSAATLDRDGEVIDSRAFDPLPDHIPFDIDHDMTVTKTVGSGKPFYAEDGSLRVKGTFASTALAQEVRSLVAEGHIRTTSVTFMAADRQKDEKGVTHVKAAELLNGTFTPIPSNREAVVLSSKAFHAVTDEKAGARNSATDQQNIQAAHDALVALGAVCGADATESMLDKSTVPDGMKSIIGSLEAQRDRVRDALEGAYPMQGAYIRGVLPDTVVFDVWGDEDCETWQQTYTDDGSLVTLTGTPVEVDVMEVVMPDADAATEPKSVTTDTDQKSADNAVESAAPVAADSTAKSADKRSVMKSAVAKSVLSLHEIRLREMGLGD